MKYAHSPDIVNPPGHPWSRRPIAFSAIVATFLIATLGGCAERDTSPPRIERLGSATAALRGDSIRVATANLWGVSVLGFDWADEIDARFAEMAERLGRNEPGLDLVLLQEAWKDSARRAMLTHPAVVENFPHRVDALERPGGSGLVVLSRFPIERTAFHRFAAQGRCFKFWEGDCISGKGVLAVQIRIGEERLWIGSTHLIACYAGDEDSESECDQQDPNGDTRWSQLVEARRFMEHLAGDAPALLGGDFNLTRSSRYYPGMTSPGIPHDPPDRHDAEATGPRSDGHRGWSESGERVVVERRIDYLWTRPGTHLHWQPLGATQRIFTGPVTIPSGESMPLSDHPILAASFCLLPNSPRPEPTICHTP